MIVELMFQAFCALVRGILSLIPSGDPPAWVSSGFGQLETIMGYGAGLGAWLPFNVAGYVLLAVLSCMAVGFVIKVVRVVASFATLGGGAAG